jgi:hypothetical protein
MNWRPRTFPGWLAILLLGTLTPAALAQNTTTGGLSGTIADNSGAALPGATVTAVHTPTGTRYETVSGATGKYALLNMRVGGPYAVTATLSGFKDWSRKDVFVKLGEEGIVNASLELGTLTEEVTVTAEVSLINPTSTGPAANVAKEAIESLPTIARGLEDFARVSPYFDAKGSGDGTDRPVLSVAGRNNRYNNIQIDGAVSNDLFAISDSSAPGNGSDGQPISLDAIQEIQLLVAPYDVRQGGFTGGGLNAITRSGANAFSGTAYYFFRNDSLTGDGPTHTPIAPYSDKQWGASLGGPIAKDKAFFFANVDIARRQAPSGFSLDGSSGTNWGHTDEVDRFLSILSSKYSYDPGGKSEFVRNANADKVFGRIDWNLAPNHQLTLRHNYLKGVTDRGFPSSRTYYMPDNWYQPHDKVHSSVAQLNSTFGTSVNEFRVSYQRIRTVTDGPTLFPQVIVDLADGSQIRAGRENFRHANELDQDVFELTDDFTMHRGNHTITLGTHNEFFKFRNLFIRDLFGSYRFSSLDNFDAGLAQQYDRSFSLTGLALQPAKFSVHQLGFYAGDTWRVRSNFTLTYGLRLDKPIFPDKPTANPLPEQLFGFATNVVPSPTMIAPRLGFNWNPGGAGRQQVRGGLGVFSGRTPYVWLSNQYGNTGIEFQRIGASFSTTNQIPFVADPNGQPSTVTGATGTAFQNEIDVVDPDYKFPKVLRTNVAYDRELPFLGLTGTVEFLYSKVLQDINYRNLNRVPGTTTRPDGRPIATRVSTALSDVILLTNTTQGRQWSVVGKVERPYRNGLYASLSYLYGRSYSINDGGSSQAASNWGNVYVPGDSNSAPLALSNYSPGSRINASLAYNFNLGKIGTTAALYYNGQSGRPYSFDYNGDANGDGRTTNDLIFVPSNADQVIFRNGTFDQFLAYAQNDPALATAIGGIVARNAGRAPWTDQLDLRLAFKIPTPGRKATLELTADVVNLLNLIDSSKGAINLASFNDLNPIRFATDPLTGKYVYDLATINAATYVKFDRDDLHSRWQMQLGARVRF